MDAPQKKSSAQRARGAQSAVLRILTTRSTVLALAALVLILYFDQASGGLFMTPTNASLLLRQTAVVAVVASGVAILIIMGEIDLSVGSAVFLTGLVAAKCQVAGWGLIPSILAALAVGVALGLVQGVVVTALAVPAFVVTLGGLLLWRGVGLIWTDAASIGPVDPNFSSMTEGRTPTALAIGLAVAIVAIVAWRAVVKTAHTAVTGQARMVAIGSPVAVAVLAALLLLWVTFGDAGLPNAILWIASIMLILGLILNAAKFGRRAFLLGSSRDAAVYAGINVPRTVMVGFLLMGAIYGIAGVMLIARVGTSTADSGVNIEMVAIAAAVIGGNSLRGGMGSIQGAVLGAFLLSTIDNGMSLLGVSTYAENVVKALILVLAVGIDGYFTRRQSLR
ncbi:ABC transporter permease subunit [Streptomyces sp. CA-179760]|uniref:ABC transporter permease subunit n=1 Tax=Streptomyces sp. CA-179760 TaxID=3240054 RepID=UPI003D8A364F